IQQAALAIDALEQLLSIDDALDGQVGVGRDRVDAYVTAAQVLVDGQRGAARAKETGNLPVQYGAVGPTHQRADLHPRRQPARLAQRTQHRSDGWEVGLRRREVAAALQRRRVRVTGHRRQARLHVVGVGVTDRTDDGQAVHDARTARQKLADAHSRNAGGDGAELALL